MDTSISKSGQLDFAVPASKIAGLSSGEFVGMIADDPDQLIKLKTFHSRILNDHSLLRPWTENFKGVPIVFTVSVESVQQNFLKVKRDIEVLIETELEILLNSVE